MSAPGFGREAQGHRVNPVLVRLEEGAKGIALAALASLDEFVSGSFEHHFRDVEPHMTFRQPEKRRENGKDFGSRGGSAASVEAVFGELGVLQFNRVQVKPRS